MKYDSKGALPSGKKIMGSSEVARYGARNGRLFPQAPEDLNSDNPGYPFGDDLSRQTVGSLETSGRGGCQMIRCSL